MLVPVDLVDEGDRLGVVDENEIPPWLNMVEVIPVGLPENPAVILRERRGDAMQSIMHGFGHGEKAFVAADHVPTGVHAELLEQGGHPGQDFGHASSHGGRIDVLDDPAGKAGAKCPKDVDPVGADDRGIVFKLRHGSATFFRMLRRRVSRVIV